MEKIIQIAVTTTGIIVLTDKGRIFANYKDDWHKMSLPPPCLCILYILNL